MGNGVFFENVNPLYAFSDTGSFIIQLQAISSDECVSFFEQTILVRPTKIDMAIESINYSLTTDGFIRPNIRLRNFGTRIEQQFEIEINGIYDYPVREEWLGFLLPGQGKDYPLKSSFRVDTLRNKIFCVSVVVSSGIDENSSNNFLCKNFGIEGSFSLGKIYPNPAHNEVTIPIIAGNEANSEIFIVDAKGKILLQYSYPLKPGINFFQLSNLTLPSGVYILLLKSGGTQVAEKLLITDIVH